MLEKFKCSFFLWKSFKKWIRYKYYKLYLFSGRYIEDESKGKGKEYDYNLQLFILRWI